MRIIFYALAAETVGALLAIFIFYQFGLSILIIRIISICGAVVLFWLASRVWEIDQIDTKAGQQILSFPKIALLTVFNSGYWIFWITVGVPKALLFDQYIVGGRFVYLLVFEFAWLLMTMLLAYIFYRFRPFLQRSNLIGTTFKVLAIILAILGVKTIIGAF
jgi:threonine/homoserine/homoserine lactone efflux protein